MTKYADIVLASAVVLLLVSTTVHARDTRPAAGAHTENQNAEQDAGRWFYDGTRERLISTVRKMLGEAHGNYIAMPPAPGIDAGLTVSQFGFAFAGIPAPMVNLPDGRKLFIGSAPHDAGEKAFVVTEGDRSTVVGVAILHQSCFGARYDKKTNSITGCPPRPILTFFVEQQNTLNAQVREDAIGWVKKYAQESNEAFRNSAPEVRKAVTVRAFDVVVENIASGAY
jgi:hypothetical protein